MQYLVQMRLAASGRPATPAEGAVFIEQVILPSLSYARSCRMRKRSWQAGP